MRVHLRKERYGGYRLGKRQRAGVKRFSPVEEPAATGPVWEYQLNVASPTGRIPTIPGDETRNRLVHEPNRIQATK